MEAKKSRAVSPTGDPLTQSFLNLEHMRQEAESAENQFCC